MTEFGGLSLGLSLVALSLLVLYMAAHWARGVRGRLDASARGWAGRSHRHLPLVWAAFELSRNYLFSGFPWANLGYTQVRTLPVAQLAALAGVYAIAALVVLVNAALARGHRGAPRARAGAAGPQSSRPRRSLALVGGARRAAAPPRAGADGGGAEADASASCSRTSNQSVKNKARDNARVHPRPSRAAHASRRTGAARTSSPGRRRRIRCTCPPGVRSLALPGYGLPALSRAHLLMGAATIERLRAGRRPARLARRQREPAAHPGPRGPRRLPEAPPRAIRRVRAAPGVAAVPRGRWCRASRRRAPGAELAVLAFPAPAARTRRRGRGSQRRGRARSRRARARRRAGRGARLRAARRP